MQKKTIARQLTTELILNTAEITFVSVVIF